MARLVPECSRSDGQTVKVGVVVVGVGVKTNDYNLCPCSCRALQYHNHKVFFPKSNYRFFICTCCMMCSYAGFTGQAAQDEDRHGHRPAGGESSSQLTLLLPLSNFRTLNRNILKNPENVESRYQYYLIEYPWYISTCNFKKCRLPPSPFFRRV